MNTCAMKADVNYIGFYIGCYTKFTVHSLFSLYCKNVDQFRVKFYHNVVLKKSYSLVSLQLLLGPTLAPIILSKVTCLHFSTLPDSYS